MRVEARSCTGRQSCTHRQICFCRAGTRSKLTAPWDQVYARSKHRLTSEDVSRLTAVKAPRFYTVESTLVIYAQAPSPCPALPWQSLE